MITIITATCSWSSQRARDPKHILTSKEKKETDPSLKMGEI